MAEKAKTAPRYEPRHFPYMNLGRIYAQKWMYSRDPEFEAALKIHPGEPTCLSAQAGTTTRIAQFDVWLFRIGRGNAPVRTARPR